MRNDLPPSSTCLRFGVASAWALLMTGERSFFPVAFFNTSAGRSREASSVNSVEVLVPLSDEFFQLVALGNCQVRRLVTIVGKVVEFPGLADWRDRFPVADADRFVPIVKPPERPCSRDWCTADSSLANTGTRLLPGAGGAPESVFARPVQAVSERCR